MNTRQTDVIGENPVAGTAVPIGSTVDLIEQ
jgi:hypothetical protein